MAEINFLCVHKKLRDKRLAPVLIKEVTRRINRRDIWQAAYVSFSCLLCEHTLTLTQQQQHRYTAGVVLPKPVGRAQYWHRSFNPEKADRGSIQLVETTYDLGTYDQVVPCCEKNTDQASSDA